MKSFLVLILNTTLLYAQLLNCANLHCSSQVDKCMADKGCRQVIQECQQNYDKINTLEMCIMSSNSINAQKLGLCAGKKRCFQEYNCPTKQCPDHCFESTSRLIDECKDEKFIKLLDCVSSKEQDECNDESCICRTGKQLGYEMKECDQC